MATAELHPPVDIESPSREPDGLYEVIDGRIKAKSVGINEVYIGSELQAILREHINRNRLGRMFAEGLFRTRANPQRVRRPDVAFLSAERWPLDRPMPESPAFAIAPDLAIEVISPTDLADAVQETVEEYLRAGVRQVWIVYRRTASITIHESLASARSYRRGEEIDGGDLLPGFRLSISDLLPEPQSESSPSPEAEPT